MSTPRDRDQPDDGEGTWREPAHLGGDDETVKDTPDAAAGATPADPVPAGGPAGWHLGVTDSWVRKWFDPDDLHSVDRALWAS